MDMKGIKVGYAFCGSFCTLQKSIEQLYTFHDAGAIITPIMSEIVYDTDTRFGSAESFREKVKEICDNEIIHTISGAEPIGPEKLLDILIISPCTGNTLGKLASGITDSSVTMAAKAHLRNERPLLIAPSTNDALLTSAKNIGTLMAMKNVYFAPFSQDSPTLKTRSCVALFDKIFEAAALALDGKQIQPILL
ncbi:MAG: dipicolinate synthase subunit B [Oscillospiraceae bacterium]